MSLEVPSDDYRYWIEIATRWMDNDMYGHVNNVQYYSFFDTVVTRWLVERGGLRPHDGDVIGLCVSSACEFAEPLSFPDIVIAGLRVGHIGRTSVRYETCVYASDGQRPAGVGHFVHVYVDRQTRTPTPLGEAFRAAVGSLVVAGGGVE